ncbi:MAG: hypothetical protein AAGK14_09125 [Verrucomicrobiota bacterium]
MNLGGWIIMIASVGGTTCFLAWCIYRVMRKPKHRELHSTLDRPPDMNGEE